MTPETADKATAALERLDDALTRLIDDNDAFREYLRLSGKMHGYSWGNRLLIHVQRPDAGMVAGYKTWTRLGRPVKRGAKGIQILAPLVRTRKDDETGDVHRWISGFRVSYVFSIHDTDGPDATIPRPIASTDDGAEARALLARLLEQARRECPVTFEDTGRAGGYYVPAEGRIALREGEAAAQSAKTLIHELAHHYAYKADASYADGEIVAESAAFVVASHYDLDTTDYSAPYVAGWASGDMKRFRDLLDRIMKTATMIIDAGQQEDSVAA
jgi:hypothetical protein